jgi:hypothetical protein
VRYILALQKFGHIRGRNRLAEQKSLPKVAAVGEQLVTVRDGLDPFRNCSDARLRPRPTIARTITPSQSSESWLTNERSILRTSTWNCLRCATEAKPVSKSSMEPLRMHQRLAAKQISYRSR